MFSFDPIPYVWSFSLGLGTGWASFLFPKCASEKHFVVKGLVARELWGRSFRGVLSEWCPQTREADFTVRTNPFGGPESRPPSPRKWFYKRRNHPPRGAGPGLGLGLDKGLGQAWAGPGLGSPGPGQVRKGLPKGPRRAAKGHIKGPQRAHRAPRAAEWAPLMGIAAPGTFLGRLELAGWWLAASASMITHLVPIPMFSS